MMLIINSSDVRAWTDALAQLAVDALLNRLRQGIRPVHMVRRLQIQQHIEVFRRGSLAY